MDRPIDRVADKYRERAHTVYVLTPRRCLVIDAETGTCYIVSSTGRVIPPSELRTVLPSSPLGDDHRGLGGEG